jgi:hypothetical protein
VTDVKEKSAEQTPYRRRVKEKHRKRFFENSTARISSGEFRAI